MPGCDLAHRSGVETRDSNKAARRNSEHFPGDFLFSLTQEEITGISGTVKAAI
jgi:hypothetical protein